MDPHSGVGAWSFAGARLPGLGGQSRLDQPGGSTGGGGYTFPYSPGAVQIDARFGVYNQQPNVIVAGGCEQPMAFYNYGRTQLTKFDCGGALVPGALPGSVPVQPGSEAGIWLAVPEGASRDAQRSRPDHAPGLPGAADRTALGEVPRLRSGKRDVVSLGVPVRQIEFFFDRRVSRRLRMIRLHDTGCALVVLRRNPPRTYCELPMQVLGA